MCKHCIVLGALINAGKKKFDGGLLSAFDCIVKNLDNAVLDTDNPLMKVLRLAAAQEEKELRKEKQDLDAESYLKDVLDAFRSRSVSFSTMKVDSDGSCLTHAISYSLVGEELFYDVLRDMTVTELSDNGSWYHHNVIPYCLYDETEFQEKFLRDIESAKPTRGKRVAAEYYLGDIHIQALANALKRPILVLSADCTVGCDKPGLLYVPLRFSREEIVRAHDGRMPSPIVLGWQSQSKNHYASMCSRSPSTEEITILDSAFRYLHFMTPVLKDLKDILNDDNYEVAGNLLNLLACSDGEAKNRFCSGWQGQVLGGSAWILRDIIRNILKKIDGQPLKMNPCELKADNKLIKQHIIDVPFAESFLRLIGFRRESRTFVVEGGATEKRDFYVINESGISPRLYDTMKVLNDIVDLIQNRMQSISPNAASMLGFLGVRSHRMADAAVSIFTCGSVGFSESSLLAKLQFFARNVPETRFQWAIQMRSLLENLKDSLDRKEDCIIGLGDLKLRAAVFRTTFSLSILESTGFIVDVRDGTECLVFALSSLTPERLKQIQASFISIRYFVDALYSDSGGVHYTGNASVAGLGNLTSLSPEAQHYLADKRGLNSTEEKWQYVTEIYGDGPFGEGQIGSFFTFGSGDPNSRKITEPIVRRMNRLLDNLSTEVRISVKLFLEPIPPGFSYMLCPVCKNLLLIKYGEIELFSLGLSDTQYTITHCPQCNCNLRVCDTNSFEMSRLFDSVFEDAERSWVCPAVCGPNNETCGVINRSEAIQCSFCSMKRPEEINKLPTSSFQDADYEDMYGDSEITTTVKVLWTCLHCTFQENVDGDDECSCCNNSRHRAPDFDIFEAIKQPDVVVQSDDKNEQKVVSESNKTHSTLKSSNMPQKRSISSNVSGRTLDFMLSRRLYGVVIPNLGPAFEAEDLNETGIRSTGIRRHSSTPITSCEFEKVKAGLSEDAKKWAEETDTIWQRTYQVENLVASMRAYVREHD